MWHYWFDSLLCVQQCGRVHDYDYFFVVHYHSIDWSPRLPASGWSLPPSPDSFRLHPCLSVQRHGVFRGPERWAETSSIPPPAHFTGGVPKPSQSTSTAEGCLAAAVVGRSRTDGRAHCDFQVALPALCFRGRSGAALDVPQVSCAGRARLAKADGHRHFLQCQGL